MNKTRRRLFSTHTLQTFTIPYVLSLMILSLCTPCASAQSRARSAEYDALQKRLATGWNTWDVHSVTTQVLLPAGLAIRIGLHHKTTLNSEAFLADALIGRLNPNAEQVFAGPHAWDGSYTDLRLKWEGRDLRIQSAHAGADLVVLITPLSKDEPGHLPATAVFSAAYLWNRPGTVARETDRIEVRGPSANFEIYCLGAKSPFSSLPVAGPYLSAELSGTVGLSTGKRRSL
ncbi:MAG: hypothetical protein WBQ89_24615, partial [Candidatus Acidiferrum sp.]